MTTKEVNLINQVGAWAKKQPWHPKHAPELGVIEEIGEAAHAELKHFQGIRGFDDIKFHDAFTDALGDAMIYLCHWCYLHNAFFQFSAMRTTTAKVAQEHYPAAMQHLIQAVSAMFSTASDDPAIASQIAGRICQGLTYWGCKYDFNLPIIVEATWLSVQQRDWNKHLDGMVECPRCHGDGCEWCEQTGRVKV